MKISRNEINEMVDNAIRLFIREEIDMGQVKSSQEKEEETEMRKKSAEERKEYEREARRLRDKIDKAENDGYTEEANRLRDELKKLKQDNGIRIVNESFKSEKLKNFAKQHGGLKNGNWSSDFVNDLYNMSDEDFDDYVITNPKEHYAKYGMGGYDNSGLTNMNFQPIEFQDGTFMVKRTPSYRFGDKEKALNRKRDERWKNRLGDGAKQYNFENPYIDKLVNGENPSDVQSRGKWGFSGENKMEKTQLNPKAIRQRHVSNTYYDPQRYAKWREVDKGEYSEPKDSNFNMVNKAEKASPRRIDKNELREMVKESVRRMLMENAIETKKVQFEDGAELTVELYTRQTRNNTCEIAHGYMQMPDGNFEVEGQYCFMNRSWQSFDYQKAMEKMISKLPEPYQREAAKQLIANELWECFMKRNKKYLQEGAYGYPDTIDGILLLSENDRECHDMYSQIAKAVNKIYKRDAKVSFERLVDSSVMKKYQQMCFRKFGKEQPDVNRTESPKRFRAYVAKKMIDEVLYGVWDERKTMNENNENQTGCYLDVYFAFELNGSNQYRKKGIGFEVVYRSDDGFTDTLAHYECYSHDDFSKPQFITTVQTDNFDIEDKEKIWKALDCGKNKEYSYNYEDEPEKVFKYKKCDIKPFVVANMDDAIKRFMSSTKPEWEKRGLNDFLNNNIINESHWNADTNDAYDYETGYPSYPGVYGYYDIRKEGVPTEVDYAQNIRNHKTGWTQKELDNRDKMMKRWLNGERTEDDIDDAWYGIHVTENLDKQSFLQKIVHETINRVIKENIDLWKNNNDVLYLQAVNSLSDYVLSQINTNLITNATDLQECDENDIQHFFSVVNDDNMQENDFYSPFSIKDFNKRHNYNIVPIFEKIVEENWNDILDEETVEAIYDKRDVSSITDKNSYGGGGYEVMKKLFSDVVRKITEKIKEK